MTLDAAMMKSRISMVAPGRPILKNLGLQCFMMVFTMSCKEHTLFNQTQPTAYNACVLILSQTDTLPGLGAAALGA